MNLDRGADEALNAFFDDVRAAADGVPAPVAGATLITLFEQGTLPAGIAVDPPPARRLRQRSLRLAVAGVVGGIAFGGLGVAGALPGPVQTRVARVVDVVGVHLPDPETTTTVAPPTTTTIVVRPSGASTPRPSGTVRDGEHATSTTVAERDGDRRGSSDDSHRTSSGSDDPRRGSGSDGGRDRGVTTTTTVDDHRVDDSGHGGDGSGSGSGSGSDGSRGLDDRRGSGGSSAGTTGATLEHQTLEDHGARVEDAARLAPGGTSLGE